MEKENKLLKRIVVADGFPFHIEKGERIIGLLTESNSEYSLKIKPYSKELYSVSGFPLKNYRTKNGGSTSPIPTHKNKRGVKWIKKYY